MWGGLVSLMLLTLFVVPVLYVVWRRWESRELWVRQEPPPPAADSAPSEGQSG